MISIYPTSKKIRNWKVSTLESFLSLALFFLLLLYPKSTKKNLYASKTKLYLHVRRCMYDCLFLLCSLKPLAKSFSFLINVFLVMLWISKKSLGP